MIAQLKGTIAVKDGMEVVIDCGGVGYLVSVPLSTTERVPGIGENVTLFTILNVREDAMQLFGFITESERNMFKLLTSIQGIGGRIALGILSSSTIPQLVKSISASDLISLQRLPGIGKKTAERMVVELKDRILKLGGTENSGATLGNTITQDAVSALQALGYSRLAAEKAVTNVLSAEPDQSHSSDVLIRKALKFATQ
ncbi:MAG: Holliday junction branch migration protein RuvA [Ignavibacteria bacterium]|nr:Holliday junction branch migration protein RuvA [Ignavibacteria bacterium]